MAITDIIPELMVEDVPASIDFYHQYLGFELETQFPDDGSPTWAQVKNNEHRIMLYLRSEFEKEIPILSGKKIGSTIELYLKVDNIDEIYRNARDKVEIIRELHPTFYGSQEFVMADNSGYLIGLSKQG